MTKDEAVLEYLLTDEQLKALYFNFGTAEDGATFLLFDNETVTKEYIDGSKEKTRVYQIAPYKDFSVDLQPDENLADMDLVVSLSQRISERAESGDFPVFETGFVKSLTVGNISIAGEDSEINLAKYMFPITIIYEE